MAGRRLIEVSLPPAQISEQSARDKSICHGHIFTLHTWSARRPSPSERLVGTYLPFVLRSRLC